MLGLIFKVLFFFAAFILAVAALLNFTDTMTWGTMSWSAPDVAPCHRIVEQREPKRTPQIVQVRWIWSLKEYGWGCYIEWADFEVETITPMPE